MTKVGENTESQMAATSTATVGTASAISNLNLDTFPPLSMPNAALNHPGSSHPSTTNDTPPRSWADLANKDHSAHFPSDTPMLEHTPTVRPVFVNYKKVSFEGFRTPLIDIAVAVGHAVGDMNVDAVQPTWNGWQIYVKTETDRTVLIASGLDVVGKHISLESQPFTVSTPNVKIIIKDLPLHEIGNDQALSTIKEICPIASEIKYSNIWVDGCKTHLHNGDRFFYVAEEHVGKFESHLIIRDFHARVIKLVLYSRCSRCQQVGHKVAADWCPAKAPPEVQQSTKAFQGSSNPLSNLFICPEGCS